MDKSAKLIFEALILIFLFVVGQVFIVPIRNLVKGSELFLVPFIMFFLLGIALIYFALKKEKNLSLRRRLLITGISAASFLVGIIFHNLFYGLAVITRSFFFLNYFFEIMHVIFFLFAVLVSPIAFIIGAVGTAYMILSNKKVDNNNEF